MISIIYASVYRSTRLRLYFGIGLIVGRKDIVLTEEEGGVFVGIRVYRCSTILCNASVREICDDTPTRDDLISLNYVADRRLFDMICSSLVVEVIQ